MWYLILCESDGSHSIVNEDSVMNIGQVNIGEDVTFFYGSKTYLGQIVMKDVDRDKLDEELTLIGKSAKRVQRVTKGADNDIPHKRRKAAPVRFSPAEASTPQKKKGSKSVKDILKDKKLAGSIAMDKQVLEAGKSFLAPDVNEDVTSDTQLQDDIFDSSDEDLLADVKEKQKRRASRQELLSLARNPIHTRVKRSKGTVSTETSLAGTSSTGTLRSSPSPDQQIETMISDESMKGTPALALKGNTSVVSSDSFKDSSSSTIEDLKRQIMEYEAKLEFYRTSADEEKEKVNSDHVSKDCTSEDEILTDQNGKFVSDPAKVHKLTELEAKDPRISTQDGQQDEMSTEDEDGESSSEPVKVSKPTELEATDATISTQDGQQDNNRDPPMMIPSDDDSQLLGKDYDKAPMIMLLNGIYCKKTVLDVALKRSAKPSQLARRLLLGVFKTQAVCNCTLSGQKPRALGRDNYGETVDGLHEAAKNAIIEYVVRISQHKRWPRAEYDVETIKRVLTQKVGEVTRAVKAGKKISGD